MATLNISLPNTMREWIEEKLASGEYANASDYLRDLIRHDQRERELLNLALIEGEQSGESKASIADIIKSQKARLRGR